MDEVSRPPHLPCVIGHPLNQPEPPETRQNPAGWARLRQESEGHMAVDELGRQSPGRCGPLAARPRPLPEAWRGVNVSGNSSCLHPPNSLRRDEGPGPDPGWESDAPCVQTAG